MKNNAKRIVCALLTAATCVTAVAVCSAIDVNVQDEVGGSAKVYTYDELSDEQKASIAYTEYDNSVFADINPVGVQRAVVIEDMVIPLTVEFEDNDKALEAVKTQCSDILSYMQEAFALDEISDSNWQKYQNSMVNVPNDEMSDQYYLLDQFFDIYENKAENDQVIKKLQTKTSIDAVVSDDDIMYELGFGDEIRQQAENR